MPARAPAQGPRPIDPQLPPDTPIEPGAGVPRLRPGTAAARIAASEAAPGEARPPVAATGGRSAAIAAARNAAKSAYLDTPVVDPKSMVRERSWFSGWAQPTPVEPAARPQSGADLVQGQGVPPGQSIADRRQRRGHRRRSGADRDRPPDVRRAPGGAHARSGWPRAREPGKAAGPRHAGAR